MFRYVDMIANPEVADVFRKRAKVSCFLYGLCDFQVVLDVL